MLNDDYYMKEALKLASMTSYQTRPNPQVGCILVKNNRIIGYGSHLKAGDPHAEIDALNRAGIEAQGATAYVTLEPCSHHGRTGPCAEALIKAGIARVVVASLDCNPKVSGQGIELLKKAGISVSVGLLADEEYKINKFFHFYMQHQRPYITLKSGMTLDAKISTSLKKSKWITSEESRFDVHKLRASYDAIMVGIGTVLADNPDLSPYKVESHSKIKRIVLDSNLRIPLDYKLCNTKNYETYILTLKDNIKDFKEKKEDLKALGVKVIELDSLEAPSVVSFLAKEGIQSLFIEGGPTIAGSFHKFNLIDEIITYIAPKIIGSNDAPSFIQGQGLEDLNQNWSFKEFTPIGPDLKIVLIKKEV